MVFNFLVHFCDLQNDILFFLTEKLFLQGTCYMVSIAAVNGAGDGEIEQLHVYTLETGTQFTSEILVRMEKRSFYTFSDFDICSAFHGDQSKYVQHVIHVNNSQVV